MDGTLKVLIVDDSHTVRDRLRALVDDVVDVRVVGEAGGLAEARVALEAVRPDVVVLDLRLGDGNGLDLLRELGGSRPRPLVIILTNDAWPQYRRECLAAGAAWFFDKTTEFHRVPEVLAAEVPGRAHGQDVEAAGWRSDEGGASAAVGAGGGIETDGYTTGAGTAAVAAVGLDGERR